MLGGDCFSTVRYGMVMMNDAGLKITYEEYKDICNRVFTVKNSVVRVSSCFDHVSRKFFASLNTRLHNGEQLDEVIEGAEKLMAISDATVAPAAL